MVAHAVHVAGTAPLADNHLIHPERAGGTIISSSAPAGLTDEAGPRTEDDQGSPVDTRSVDSERDPGARATQILQLKAQEEAESNKESHALDPSSHMRGIFEQSLPRRLDRTRKPLLIDPQPGAVRVTFDSQELTQDALSKNHGKQNNHSGIEIEDQQEEMENPTPDQGFQQDTRPIDVESRRTSKPLPKRLVDKTAIAKSNAQKRGRQTSKSQVARKRSKGQRSSQVENEENDVTRGNPEEENISQFPPSQLDNYKKANSSAKYMKAETPKRAQSRRAWTDLETEKLIALIEEYGISWAQLKDYDGDNGVLANRDQVALKDKARNMKLDYLKYVHTKSQISIVL